MTHEDTTIIRPGNRFLGPCDSPGCPDYAIGRDEDGKARCETCLFEFEDDEDEDD